MAQKPTKLFLGVCLFSFVEALPLAVFAQGNCIKLLIALPCGTQCLQAGAGPFAVLKTYFDCFYPWIVGTAAGIAILWTIVAGAALIFYAGDETKRTEAKGWFKNAIIGLFIVLFSAMIMNFINPIFYKV